jgi:hypothetical protein
MPISAGGLDPQLQVCDERESNNDDQLAIQRNPKDRA